MNNVDIVKCPICGESNFITLPDESYKCKVCNSHFFNVEKDHTLILKEAQNALKLYDFTKADLLYQNLINDTSNEKTKVMALFGRILAYFGIVFIKDFNQKLVVTVSRFDKSFQSIKECSYFDELTKSIYFNKYTESIDAIDQVYQNLASELSNDELFDAFICTKISLKTSNNQNAEGYTVDSNYATKIYDELTKRGLKVFYSDKTLAGIEYDSQIYSALMRSKKIIIVTTKKEYLESAWVQSEWQRWVSFINNGFKEKDSLFLYVPTQNHFELPHLLSKTQIFDDSLTLVNTVCNALKQKEVKITESLDDLLKVAKNELVLNDFEKAEAIYKDLCLKYEDYRPWLGLVECLIEQDIPSKDKRYLKYLTKAINLCSLPELQDEIHKKYSLYISTSNKDNLYLKALEHYNKNEFLEAQQIFERLESENHKESLYYLGKIMEMQQHIKDSFKKALKYYERSAKLGFDIAANELGEIFFTGRGTKQNVKKAFTWYQLAAELNNVHSQYMMGLYYESGWGVSQDYKKAIAWYKLAATKEDINACLKIASIYSNGKGVEQNFEEANKWYKQASDLGFKLN